MPLRRLAADWGIPVGLACMVVAFAAGSGSEPWAKRTGLDARWVVLALLCAAAVISAAWRLWATRSLPPRGVVRFGALAGSFLVIAVVSTGWSVAPRLTFERAGSLAILFLLGAAIATSTARDVEARARLFQGLAAGALAVGVLGALVLVFDYHTAVQGQGKLWRYRGFTENPNTIGILAGAALPILVAVAIRSKNRWRQAGWLAGTLFMIASIIASESRGGLLAACAGTLVVTTLGVERRWHRVAAATALLAVFAAGFALRQVAEPPTGTFISQVQQAPPPPKVKTHKPVPPKPTSTTPKPPVTSKGHPAPKPKPRPKKHHKKPHKPPAPKPLLVLRTKTSALPNEQDEIGHPALSKSGTTTLASGRLAEWKGTLELIGDRPILGYGFGTEQNVFVDRWYTFQGGTAENSYLGLLLQVGIVGLLLITAIGLALIVGAVRALRVLRGDERVVVAAGLGVLVAAAAIMLIQSYLYSVGNVATGTVWISLFVLGAVALEPAPKTAAASVPAPAHEAAA